MVYVAHVRRVIRNVPIELWQRLRVLAAERNTSISALVIEAIVFYVHGEEYGEEVEAEDCVVEVKEHL